MRISGLFNLPVIIMAFCLIAMPAFSHASEFFIGIDGTPYVAWKDCTFYVSCSSGHATYGGATNGHGTRLGVRAGYWLSQTDDARSGVEIGYESLGSYTANTEWFPNGCVLPFCNGPASVATWKFDGTILYLDWFGYLRNKPQSWTNGLLFKFGLFGSTTKTEGTYTAGGMPYMRKVSGAGLVLGAGYVAPLTPGLSARAVFDMYFGVKVADPTSISRTFSDSLFKFSLGLDYSF